jgi:hypothetical protein
VNCVRKLGAHYEQLISSSDKQCPDIKTLNHDRVKGFVSSPERSNVPLIETITYTNMEIISGIVTNNYSPTCLPADGLRCGRHLWSGGADVESGHDPGYPDDRYISFLSFTYHMLGTRPQISHHCSVSYFPNSSRPIIVRINAL